MQPLIVSQQVTQGVADFLRTAFPSTTSGFEGLLERFLAERSNIFKGPYLTLPLPFRKQLNGGLPAFPWLPASFVPHAHQAKAFARLAGSEAQSTLVATGTGSGKTECFLYPILEHCRVARAEGRRGIKAIILYPMNALASDQSGRVAKEIVKAAGLSGIRAGLNESPEFLEDKALAEKARALKPDQAPVIEVLKTAWRPLLLCIGANTLGIAGVYFTNTFMIAYSTQQLGLPRSLILECLFVVAIIQFCVQPLAAWVAEKVGATRFLCAMTVLAMASPYPMFVLVSSGEAPLIILGIALAVVCMASFYAVIAGFVSGLFETRVRYTAISLAYQVCGALAGGLTPLIGTWLAHEYQGQWWPMAVFYSLIAAVSLVSVLALSRRHATAHRLEMAPGV